MKKNLFVLAAVIFSFQSFAQQGDSTGRTLDEVVLTANKYPSKTSLTGKVVTVITREQLDRAGSRDLSQVLATQAGIFIGGANSNTGKDKSLYLRGARVDHTLITIDGVPVYDPSGIGGNFDIRNLSVAAIERIEIVKGSQSTLYGSDAIAGVINIITKKTAAKKTEGTAMLSTGSFNSWKAAANLQGHAGKSSYQLGLQYFDTKGINETENKSGAPVTDRDGYRQFNLQAGVTTAPAKNWSLQPFVRYSTIEGAIDQGAFTDELDYDYRQESWQAGVQNSFSFGKTRLQVNYNYNRVFRRYTDDSVKSRNGFDTWSQGRYSGGEHFADIYITSPLGKSFKLVGGADYRSSRSDQDYSSIGFFGPYATRYSADSLHQQQTGIYAALNYGDDKGFHAEAGGRINLHSTYGSHAVFNFNPSFLVQKKIKLFTNLSSAYRTPSLYQLFSEYGNRDLQPEAAVTAEAGVQYFGAGGKWMTRLTGFTRNVKDVIFFYTNPATFQSQYFNQDKQRDHGVEAELNYTISERWSLATHYTYVTGKITTVRNGKDTSYFNLLRRPKSSGDISISYKAGKRGLISTNLLWAGKREDAYFDNNSFTTVNLTLASYYLWDLYGEYRVYHNRLAFFADLRNITGTKYTEIAGFATPGFNGTGGIRFNF